MSWIAIVASTVPAAVTLGGGLYKLGSGLVAMAATVRELVAYHEDHEARLKALETAAAARSRRAPRSLVTVTIKTRRCNERAPAAIPPGVHALTCRSFVQRVPGR